MVSYKNIRSHTRSSAGCAPVRVQALDLVVVRKVRLGLVHCDHRFEFTLISGGVSNGLWTPIVRREDAYLAPLAKETNVVDPGCVCALRSGEEQRDRGDVRKFCRSAKVFPLVSSLKQHSTTVNLQDMVLADIAALGYRELLYRLEVCDVGEVDILDVWELESVLSDRKHHRL